MLQGVDVARYQGIIDWDKLKTVKDFAIIKATGGCPDKGESDAKYTDSSFKRNRDEARRTGILRGFYHYAYPEYNTPEAEAVYFARVMKDLQAGECVVLDYESSWSGNAVDFCLRWLKKVEEILGVKPLIYLNLYTTNSHDWSSVIANGNGLWVAQWTYAADGKYNPKNPWPFAAMHQYSNREKVQGIPADVDGDVFLGDVVAFRKYGKGGAVTPTPNPEPTPTPVPTPTPDPIPEPPKPDEIVFQVVVSKPEFVDYSVITFVSEGEARAEFEKRKEELTDLHELALNRVNKTTNVTDPLDRFIKPATPVPDEIEYNISIQSGREMGVIGTLEQATMTFNQMYESEVPEGKTITLTKINKTQKTSETVVTATKPMAPKFNLITWIISLIAKIWNSSRKS